MKDLKTFDIDELEGMFAKPEDETFDSIEVVNIDIDAIGDEAQTKATSLIEDLTKFYYDEEFLKSNPNFRRRVDNDMESLRMLLKMRAADEVTHDVLIKAIAANSGNASLYGSLTKVQSTILQITTKIENIVTNLTTMIKGYQMELNFKYENEMSSETETPMTIEDSPTTHRGSKSFIESMKVVEENQELYDQLLDSVNNDERIEVDLDEL